VYDINYSLLLLLFFSSLLRLVQAVDFRWSQEEKHLEDYWKSLTPALIEFIMEQEAKRSQFHLVSECVKNRLVDQALCQRQILATEAISNEAASLCKQYQYVFHV
jgi:hypothetical protein